MSAIPSYLVEMCRKSWNHFEKMIIEIYSDAETFL